MLINLVKDRDAIHANRLALSRPTLQQLRIRLFQGIFHTLDLVILNRDVIIGKARSTQLPATYVLSSHFETTVHN